MRETAKLTNDILDLCRIIPQDSIGIEIGCFKGESTRMFLESNKLERLYCVDPWDPTYYRTVNMEEVLTEFNAVANDYPDIAIPVRMKSEDMFKLIKDPFVNFIYIDGDHSYEAVKKDIASALNLLRASRTRLPKILAGHDYKHPKSPGVEKAVKELLQYPDIRFAGYSWAKIIDR